MKKFRSTNRLTPTNVASSDVTTNSPRALSLRDGDVELIAHVWNTIPDKNSFAAEVFGQVFISKPEIQEIFGLSHIEFQKLEPVRKRSVHTPERKRHGMSSSNCERKLSTEHNTDGINDEPKTFRTNASEIVDPNFQAHCGRFITFWNEIVVNLSAGSYEKIIQLSRQNGQRHCNIESVTFEAKNWLIFKSAFLLVLFEGKHCGKLQLRSVKSFASGLLGDMKFRQISQSAYLSVSQSLPYNHSQKKNDPTSSVIQAWQRLLCLITSEMKSAFHEGILIRCSAQTTGCHSKGAINRAISSSDSNLNVKANDERTTDEAATTISDVNLEKCCVTDLPTIRKLHTGEFSSNSQQLKPYSVSNSNLSSATKHISGFHKFTANI